MKCKRLTLEWVCSVTYAIHIYWSLVWAHPHAHSSLCSHSASPVRRAPGPAWRSPRPPRSHALWPQPQAAPPTSGGRCSLHLSQFAGSRSVPDLHLITSQIHPYACRRLVRRLVLPFKALWDVLCLTGSFCSMTVILPMMFSNYKHIFMMLKISVLVSIQNVHIRKRFISKRLD